MGTVLQIYLIAVLVVSVITFVAYGWDKRAARRGSWRISERTLFTLALLGGWPGGLLGARVFRHKTRKLSYRLIYGLIVALHVLLAWWMLWRWTYV